jgi:hypothetical protein
LPVNALRARLISAITCIIICLWISCLIADWVGGHGGDTRPSPPPEQFNIAPAGAEPFPALAAAPRRQNPAHKRQPPGRRPADSPADAHGSPLLARHDVARASAEMAQGRPRARARLDSLSDGANVPSQAGPPRGAITATLFEVHWPARRSRNPTAGPTTPSGPVRSNPPSSERPNLGAPSIGARGIRTVPTLYQGPPMKK